MIYTCVDQEGFEQRKNGKPPARMYAIETKAEHSIDEILKMGTEKHKVRMADVIREQRGSTIIDGGRAGSSTVLKGTWDPPENSETDTGDRPFEGYAQKRRESLGMAHAS